MKDIAEGNMTILHKADHIINGARKDDYGNAEENFGRIATIWSCLLGADVTPAQVVQCMIALKLARLFNTPDHYDSWLDIAGYVGVWEHIQIAGYVGAWEHIQEGR